MGGEELMSVEKSGQKIKSFLPKKKPVILEEKRSEEQRYSATIAQSTGNWN